MSELEFNEASLMAAPIKDEELAELLERLAATDVMFQTPVSTIRDVAEATDVSPNLIARILGEMRGPGESEKIAEQFESHNRRLIEVEQEVKRIGQRVTEVKEEPKINRPNVVGSTVEKQHAEPKKQEESPPQAWVDHKRKLEYERNKEQLSKSKQFQAFLIKQIAYVALVIVVIWIVYATVTSGPPSVPLSPIVR